MDLSQIRDTFHVSQLRKCIADESVVVPLEDIQVDAGLNYANRPIAIRDRKIKVLRNKEYRWCRFSGSIGRGPSWRGSQSQRCGNNIRSCFRYKTSRVKSGSSGGEL